MMLFDKQKTGLKTSEFNFNSKNMNAKEVNPLKVFHQSMLRAQSKQSTTRKRMSIMGGKLRNR